MKDPWRQDGAVSLVELEFVTQKKASEDGFTTGKVTPYSKKSWRRFLLEDNNINNH